MPVKSYLLVYFSHLLSPSSELYFHAHFGTIQQFLNWTAGDGLIWLARAFFPLEHPDLSYGIARLIVLSSPPHRSEPENIPQFMGRSLWPCKAYRFSNVYSLSITHAPALTEVQEHSVSMANSCYLLTCSAVKWAVTAHGANELWQEEADEQSGWAGNDRLSCSGAPDTCITSTWARGDAEMKIYSCISGLVVLCSRAGEQQKQH